MHTSTFQNLSLLEGGHMYTCIYIHNDPKENSSDYLSLIYVGCYFTIFFVVAKQTLNKLQTNPFLKAKPSPEETEKGLKPSMQLWANIPEANGNIVLSDSEDQYESNEH